MFDILHRLLDYFDILRLFLIVYRLFYRYIFNNLLWRG